MKFRLLRDFRNMNLYGEYSVSKISRYDLSIYLLMPIEIIGIVVLIYLYEFITVLMSAVYRNFISTCIFRYNQFEMRVPFRITNEGFDNYF